jgi:hypothetical protein
MSASSLPTTSACAPSASFASISSLVRSDPHVVEAGDLALREGLVG